jgi:UDP-N-acetylmuramyl pentapeptide phosphotransferase/UDP-N-acetylglucosamine-1-phosphate transferase
MFYYLSHYSAVFGPLNVFRYETFRATAAALTSLVLSFALGPRMILLLTRLKLGQPLRLKSEVRELADLHSSKKGTPTMGGLLILVTVTLSSLLWCDPANRLYWLVLGSMLFLGFIGFADDYEKVAKKNSKGIRGWQKLAAQLLLAVFVFNYLRYNSDYPGASNGLYIPFLKTPVVVDMGVLALVFFALVIMGTSNAVNLTDGLDGLAIGCSISVALTYAIFCYLSFSSLGQRRGRHRGLLRGAGRQRARVPLVQLSSGAGVHGRYGLARARRRARRDRHLRAPGTGVGHRRRRLRHRGRLGAAASRLLQAHRQTDFRDVTSASSL